MRSVGELRHPCKRQRVSRLGSVTARYSSSGRRPNFAALNKGRHLYLAWRPSRWALAHISSSFFFSLLHFSCVIDDTKCIVVTRVCLCVSVRGRMPTLLHWPGCNLGDGTGWPLVGQICSRCIAWVSLLWQHSTNAKFQRVLVLTLRLFFCLFQSDRLSWVSASSLAH